MTALALGLETKHSTWLPRLVLSGLGLRAVVTLRAQASDAAQATNLSKLSGAHAVRVMVDPDLTLIRKLLLPAAAKKDLQAVAALDLAQNTPFSAASALSALGPARKTDRQLEITQYVLRRDLFDELCAHVEQAGARLVEVVLDAPGAPVLWSDPKGLRSERRWLGLATAMFVGAAGLQVAQGLVQSTRLEAQLVEVERQNQILADQAVALRQAQEAAGAVQSDEEQALQRLVQSRQTLSLLTRLTELLPEDTYITELRMAGSQITLGGTSSGPTETLAARLQNEAWATDARFLAPILRDPRSSRDRFQVQFQMVPSALETLQ